MAPSLHFTSKKLYSDILTVHNKSFKLFSKRGTIIHSIQQFFLGEPAKREAEDTREKRREGGGKAEVCPSRKESMVHFKLLTRKLSSKFADCICKIELYENIIICGSKTSSMPVSTAYGKKVVHQQPPSFLEKVTASMNSRLPGDMIYLEFAKAFDKVGTNLKAAEESEDPWHSRKAV